LAAATTAAAAAAASGSSIINSNCSCISSRLDGGSCHVCYIYNMPMDILKLFQTEVLGLRTEALFIATEAGC